MELFRKKFTKLVPQFYDSKLMANTFMSAPSTSLKGIFTVIKESEFYKKMQFNSKTKKIVESENYTMPLSTLS